MGLCRVIMHQVPAMAKHALQRRILRAAAGIAVGDGLMYEPPDVH
jgi:hypothetical protein